MGSSWMPYILVLGCMAMLTLDFFSFLIHNQTMSEMGDRYRKAQEIVLKRYATEPGEKGQSQEWKIKAIEEDRAGNRFNTSIMEIFADDVEREVNRLLSIRPIVQKLSEKTCEKVSTEPLKPSLPPKQPPPTYNELN